MKDLILIWFGFFKYVDRSRSRHVTTKCTMGCVISTPTFYHPDLLAVFCCDPTNNFWGFPLKPYWFRLFWGFPLRFRCFYNDPGWVRNSPLRIELVDLLNDALKAMGGWPAPRDCCGCNWLTAPPQMLEAFNKVCKKFNDAKLFDMGLQCRASINRYKLLNSKMVKILGISCACWWKKKVTKSFAMWARHWNGLVFWRKRQPGVIQVEILLRKH